MFNKLRNRFLLLLMVTVTVLLFMCFATILAVSYQNFYTRNTEMLNRGVNFLQSTGQSELKNADKFSPIFTVDIDKNGNVISLNSRFTIDEEIYTYITKVAQNSAQNSGNVAYSGLTFRYKFFNTDNGKRLVFIDISRDLQAALSMAYSFLWLSIPLLIIVFFISKYFANRAILPIKQSFERQNQFIADASHELKTPLAAINANASLLLDSAKTDQIKWLTCIKDETIRLEKLTRDLLYLSREPVKSQYENCDISLMLNEILIPLEAVFYENNITCLPDIEPDLKVFAEPDQLRRILGVFVENAIKYTQDSIEVTLKKHGKTITFTVSNNGCGIAQDDLTKIWDRFYRTDKARIHKGGFGLGLAMAKSIAGEMGATLKASSSPNQLTTFTMQIPPI